MISPYVRRLRLAQELRTLRAKAGVTHEQLAKKIGQSRAQISRLENGHVADQADVMKILDALGVDGDPWTKVMLIAREAAERGWWESYRGMGERQALYADLEAGAATIREYQMTFIPGLLQTPEYTRERAELDRRAGVGVSGSGASFTPDKVVEARSGRQRMLRRPGGPSYEVVIDELAIRRGAVRLEVVKSQLYHLAATTNASPKINVRMLPVNAVIPDYNVPRSAFSLYTFTDSDDPRVVAVDNLTGDQVITNESEVKRYEDQYERLRDAAMPAAESLELLARIATKPGPIGPPGSD
jgi:transcriptional regulator with XRE-family HTH domain